MALPHRKTKRNERSISQFATLCSNLLFRYVFILGMNEEDYRYAMDQQDYALLNKYLYRVQKLSKGDYNFRYHTETSVEDKYDGKLNLELSRQMGKLKRVSIKSLLGLNPHKVHISVLGEIKEIS